MERIHMGTLGNKLKEARKGKNMSQEEVSKRLLISRQSISKWENNVCLPDLENFKKICELYEMDTSDLLENKNAADVEEKKCEKPLEINEIEHGSLVRLNDAELEVENIVEIKINIKHFLIPFYWSYYLTKRLYKNNFSKKIAILIVLNIAISFGLLYFFYCEVPKTTSMPSRAFSNTLATGHIM